MARMSCPARLRYPARTSLSACGSRSASRSTCRVNSVFVGTSSSGDEPGDRPKNDGRLRVLLRRRMVSDADAFPEDGGDDDSMSVCERCTRPGSARGPPGTDGALTICTGRGFGMAVRLCLVVRAGSAGLFTTSFLVLTFLPREEKKVPATLDPIDRDVACDSCAPVVVVEWREFAVETPASAG